METTITQPILLPAELLKNWQGHRKLTRRVIEAFPEKELFEFSLGNMRPFAAMVKEMLAIAVPGLKEIVTGINTPFDDQKDSLNTKASLLEAWDETTEQINIYWRQIRPEMFREEVNLFGQYKFAAIDNAFYFIENEIHHRGQGYVYLRALGIEPPFFWERY
jgi:uncharacterized damage-inducible protein DinB